MRSLRRPLVYAFFLLVCAELSAKLLLLTPWVRGHLPAESPLSWRARWVGRYLFTDRSVFYGFDDPDPTKGWVLRPGLRDFRQFAGSTVSSNARGARGRDEPP